MATIPRQEVVAYAAMMERVQREAARKAKAAVKKWLSEHPTWEAADLRNACTEICAGIVSEYGNAMSSLACDLYDGTMGGTVARAEPWDGDLREAVQRAVRYQLKKALDGDADSFVDAIGGMVEYNVRRHANETTMANCERDNRLYAEGGANDAATIHQPMDMPAYGQRRSVVTRGPRRRGRSYALELGMPAFARVPTGAETCTYCLMLASRGFVYHTRDSAGHADHRGCNCLIVAGRKGDRVEGIDEHALYDCWQKLEAMDAYYKLHPNEITPAELESRKKKIVDGYGDSVTASTEPGEVRKLFATLQHFPEGTVGGWYEPRMKTAGKYKP